MTFAWPDMFGYLAAMLLLLTFFMREMIPLRSVAIASSIAWLVYGWADHIYPVLCLHVILLPLNGVRLFQALRRQVARSAAGPIPAAPIAAGND